MENIIVLKGTEEVVKIVGLEEVGELGKRAIECLNENNKLEEVVKDNAIEAKQTDDDIIEINGHEYYVFNGLDKARGKAIKMKEELLDGELWEMQNNIEKGIGIDRYSRNTVRTALENEFVKMYEFKNFWKKENYLKVWEGTEIEEIATEEQLKEIEQGLTEEKYIREDYEEMLNFEVSGRWLEEYLNGFGERMTMEKIIKEELVDTSKLARYYVTSDNLASYFAHYDGEELTHNNIYMYRID